MKTKRIFIGFFGRRNQGKSSLINALAQQEVSIVSPIAGTTTDPVKKSMEIIGIGPVVLIDTAGLDDVGSIGSQRSEKSKELIKTIDVAVIVISHNQYGSIEHQLIQQFQEYQIPFLFIHNKADEQPLTESLLKELSQFKVPIIETSTQTHQGIDAIAQNLATILPKDTHESDTLLGNFITAGDQIVLVMPQDSEAPEGRLILPQVQVIRDILDNHAIATCLQPEELHNYLQQQKPTLIITDSQVFNFVSKIVPSSIPLTSFSILLSQAKGNFNLFIKDTKYIDSLKDDDRILMLESCSHTISCDDIGRHKIPNLLQQKTGKKLQFDFITALSPLPTDLSPYAMAIQCGGCMVTKKQLQNRINQVHQQGLPITNYGLVIAYLTGIFDRVTEIMRK